MLPDGTNSVRVSLPQAEILLVDADESSIEQLFITEFGKEIERKGVTIIGLPELQRLVPLSASQMFSSNLYNFMEHFWDKEAKHLMLNQDDEIIKGCLIIHEGQIVHSTVKEAIG